VITYLGVKFKPPDEQPLQPNTGSAGAHVHVCTNVDTSFKSTNLTLGSTQRQVPAWYLPMLADSDKPLLTQDTGGKLAPAVSDKAHTGSFANRCSFYKPNLARSQAGIRGLPRTRFDFTASRRSRDFNSSDGNHPHAFPRANSSDETGGELSSPAPI
jgi:hypothetical protein